MTFVWIIASTFVVSLISLVGIFTIGIKEKLLAKLLFFLIGFSAGALLGGAFLHILPEALETNSSLNVFSYLILGLILFFLLERYLHWRHCHQEEGTCKTHPFTYLSLVGDTFHNFIDGMLIAVSYLVSIKLGLVTTIAVILHEIPQELGDFGVLVYGGFSKRKALACNFISAIAAVAGAAIAYFVADSVQGFSNLVLPITAGGFIYIAASDLIPEIHKERNQARATMAFAAFIFGIIFMALARKFLPN
jgi:zinc and cadmium transporter